MRKGGGGGAGAIEGRAIIGLKGRPAEKILSVGGNTPKITLKCLDDSIYDSAQFFLPKCPKIAFLRF